MTNRKVTQGVRIKKRAHSTHSTRIVFVGAGHLGGAVINSLLAQKIYVKKDLFVITGSEASAKKWKRTGIKAAAQDYSAIAEAKEVWLAVKPHQIREVAAAVRPYLKTKVQVISLLAGWTPSHLQQLLGNSNVVSVMTNTAARVNAGLFAIFYSNAATRLVAKKLMPRFKKLGFVCGIFSEIQMPDVTALVGSAPAFLLHLQAQYMQYAAAHGVRPVIAKAWFSALVASCDKLSADHVALEPLMAQIATPGGCTERGLLVLGASNSLHAALVSCADRAKELGA